MGIFFLIPISILLFSTTLAAETTPSVVPQPSLSSESNSAATSAKTSYTQKEVTPLYGYGLLGFFAGAGVGLISGMLLAEIGSDIGYAGVIMGVGAMILGAPIGSAYAVHTTGERYGENGSALATGVGAVIAFAGTLALSVAIAPSYGPGAILAVPIVTPLGAVIGYRISDRPDDSDASAQPYLGMSPLTGDDQRSLLTGGIRGQF